MKIIKIFLLVVFICILGFCSWKLYNIKKEEDNADNLKEELIEIIDIPDVVEEQPEELIDFKKLIDINPDIVGWIIIEDTQVNYPIVKGNNNSYYLNHSYDKKWSGYGSIFMDYESSKDFSDYNTFVYGHNTKNGSMFGELYKYIRQNFYDEHPTFNLYTPSNNYIVEVISAYVDDTESDSYIKQFASLDDYQKYIDLIISKSRIKTNITLDYKKDKIITLYSCSHETNHKKTDRYFIHGVLRKI